jgi:hypothetical protein
MEDLMAQPHNSRASRAAPARAKPARQPLHVYEVKGDAAKVLAELKLPQGASVAIIPSSPTVEAKLLKLAPGRIARYGEVRRDEPPRSKTDRSSPQDTSAAVDASAFEPDARARAVLRGLEYAREDLRDAGGAYDLDQVRAVLNGVSRQAVTKRVKDGSLLAVPGPNGKRSYPTFQFTGEGTVVGGMKAVLDAFPSKNPWMVLNFLVNPQDALGGRKPIDLLRAGDVDAVVSAARRIGVQGA